MTVSEQVSSGKWDSTTPLRCRESTKERGKSMRSIKFLAARSITLLATLIALSGAFAGAAQAEPGTHVKLTPVGGGSGGGMIGISPTAHDLAGHTVLQSDCLTATVK